MTDQPNPLPNAWVNDLAPGLAEFESAIGKGPDLDRDRIAELDDILDDLRTRNDETPQWDFCEGFMVALICCRRVIEPAEYIPQLLDIALPPDQGEGSFTDDAQMQKFYALWHARWAKISQALATEVDTLEDEHAYYPSVLDVRGALAAMSAESRAEMTALHTGKPPAFAQVWALGFMFAVESWHQEWVPPRDKHAAKALDACLHDIIALTEDDTDPPTISTYGEDHPPSISSQRVQLFAAATWAVYELFAIWRDIGPRGETVYRQATPGRNDPCFCGSGKKYKKCHGA
jgi:uncharacterized protein